MKNEEQAGSFVVNVYTPGNQIIQTQNNNYYGPVYQGGGKGSESGGSYSDEQIARAIMAVSGEGKPLSLMKHFVGVICALQSMGWSSKFATCCARINQLPGHEQFPVRCDSNAIKSTQALKFASVDYKDWATYQPKAGEEAAVFKGCKFAADSFVEVLTGVTE